VKILGASREALELNHFWVDPIQQQSLSATPFLLSLAQLCHHDLTISILAVSRGAALCHLCLQLSSAAFSGIILQGLVG